MSTLSSKELLLYSVLSAEMDRIGGKLDFWQIDHPSGKTMWQTEKPISLEEALSCIDPESSDLRDSVELGLLYCIGWEFIWGKKPPEIVTVMRDELLSKVKSGLELNDLERLWYGLVITDTDMF